MGGSDLPLLSKVFSWLQRATIIDHGSLLSTNRSGDHSAFIVARVSYGSSHGGRGGHGGRGFCGGHDYRGGGCIGGQGLANALIVVVLTILWIFVGIYMAHHLGLPIKLLLPTIP